MNILIYSIIAIGYFVGFYLLFPKAGRKAWEGLVPVYNFYVLTKVTKKPWWWMLLLIFPGVNILMLMVFNSNLASVFGKREMADQVKAVLLPFIFFPLWGRQDIKYVGPLDRKKHKKSTRVEWGEAIVFAVIAASIIRTYFLEAFTIPTSSMEKTLLIGDYLFVSKMAYGPKVPQTPLSFPFAHHTLPGTNTPSYLEWMKLPYYRLPGFGDVERNDIVVFNYPEGDTVCVEVQSSRSYNQLLRDYTEFFGEKYARDFMWNGIPARVQQNERVQMLMGFLTGLMNNNNLMARQVIDRGFTMTVRPIDKREHYIKRCVAIHGDEIKIDHGVLSINGEMAYIPPEFQYNYAALSGSTLNAQIMKDKLGLSNQDFAAMGVESAADGSMLYKRMPMTIDMKNQLRSWGNIKDLQIDLHPSEDRWSLPIFPNLPGYGWSEDFWGPLTVPEAGATVELTPYNLPFYSRVITIYEGHDLKVEGDNIFIDGEETTSYTFAMNYYFMMGDNRHNSADSRFWGFVPEDHIVGRAAFIWLSLDKEKTLFDGKIRFSRMFSIPE